MPLYAPCVPLLWRFEPHQPPQNPESPSDAGRAFLFVCHFVCVVTLSLLDHRLHPVYPQPYPVTLWLARANIAVSFAGTPCLLFSPPI
jgi:hypothetical protein